MPPTPNNGGAATGDELPVGRIAGIFGLRGELKCDPTGAGRTLFSAGERLRARLQDGESVQIVLESVREHKGRLLVRLSGLEDATAAQRYAGATLYAAAGRIALEEGEFLDRDLVGCELFDAAGTPLGTVERVEHYPASDMLVVRGNMVPMIAQFVKSIDLANRRIAVELPPGLLDPENAERA